MITKIIRYVAAAALMVGFAACNDDDSPTYQTPHGTDGA